MLVVAGADLLASGQHDLGLEQVVDRQAALAAEMTHSADEGEPADARRRDDPARRGEPMLARGGVDLAPDAAAADPYDARLGIDVDALQQGKVDDDSVVDGAEPRAVVPATADRQRQTVVACEA